MKSLCTSFKVLTPPTPPNRSDPRHVQQALSVHVLIKPSKVINTLAAKFKTSINFIVPPVLMWGLWFAVSYIGPPCSFSDKLGIPRTHSNPVPQEVNRSEEYICLTINSDWNWRTNKNSFINEIMYLKKYRY